MTSSSGTGKRIAVILNGISLRKKFFYHEIYPRLARKWDVEVHETLSKNDAVTLASRATEKNVNVILAAGGDGTLNQVLNGVLRGREIYPGLPAIGLIPIGSGNDFARTAGISKNYSQLETLIEDFRPRKLDVGKIVYTPLESSADERKLPEQYFINVADIGMGPVVVEKVLNSGRAFGHGAAYYMGILSTFASYKPMMVKAVTPTWQWQGKVRTLAVGNGKYYGHGLCIAPDAIPDDRKFNVFICGNVSVFDFILQTGNLKKGKHLKLRDVSYRETTEIELTSEAPCMIEGDGEILGTLPAKISLIERQVDFLMP